MARPANATPKEHDEQKVFVEWLTLRHIPHFAVDNEQHRGQAFALDRWRKAQGFVAGAPDIVILALAPKTNRPVVVEMKREVGGVQSPAQKYIGAICRRQGFHYLYSEGADEAIGQMVDLGFAVSRGPQWEVSENDRETIRLWEMQALCGRSVMGEIVGRQMGSVERQGNANFPRRRTQRERRDPDRGER